MFVTEANQLNHVILYFHFMASGPEIGDCIPTPSTTTTCCACLIVLTVRNTVIAAKVVAVHYNFLENFYLVENLDYVKQYPASRAS